MTKKIDKGFFVYVSIYNCKLYGMECAVMIHELQAHSRQREKVFEDDLEWFSLSVSDLNFLFPFWTKTQSKLVLQRLMDDRVIKSKPGKKRHQKFFAFVSNKDLE